MNLLTQFSFLNGGRAGAAVGGGGSVLGPVLGFFSLFFLQPYYNAFILSVESVTGLSAFNPIMPLTLMAIAVCMFFGPIFARVSSLDGEKKQGFLIAVFKTLIGFAMMATSVPLFIFGLIHWWFYTSS